MSESEEPRGLPNLTAAERETVVNATDDDDVVRVWTAQRKFITRLRKHPAFTEVRSGCYGSTVWAEFTIPVAEWNPATGAKRRHTVSEEQREVLRARAARMREVAAAKQAVDGGFLQARTGANELSTPGGSWGPPGC